MIREITFPFAFIKHYEEIIDPYTGDGRFVILLMPKPDKATDIIIDPANDYFKNLVRGKHKEEPKYEDARYLEPTYIEPGPDPGNLSKLHNQSFLMPKLQAKTLANYMKDNGLNDIKKIPLIKEYFDKWDRLVPSAYGVYYFDMKQLEWFCKNNTIMFPNIPKNLVNDAMKLKQEWESVYPKDQKVREYIKYRKKFILMKSFYDYQKPLLQKIINEANGSLQFYYETENITRPQQDHERYIDDLIMNNDYQFSRFEFPVNHPLYCNINNYDLEPTKHFIQWFVGFFANVASVAAIAIDAYVLLQGIKDIIQTADTIAAIAKASEVKKWVTGVAWVTAVANGLMDAVWFNDIPSAIADITFQAFSPLDILTNKVPSFKTVKVGKKVSDLKHDIINPLEGILSKDIVGKKPSDYIRNDYQTIIDDINKTINQDREAVEIKIDMNDFYDFFDIESVLYVGYI